MKRLLLSLGVAGLAATLSACGGGGGGGSTTYAVPNPIVFCVDTTYPPAESLVNGKPTGYDIDIANAIAKQLGSTAQIKVTGFTVIISALKQKKCDAIISSMTITPDRAKQVDFAPYLDVGTFLMVKKGNPSNISDLASLSGKTAAVQSATTQLDALNAENKILQKQKKPLISINTYPADTSAAAAIQAGKVDAYLADATPVLYYIRQTGGQFQTTGPQIGVAPEGVATRKGDPLRGRINRAIQTLYRNGKMKTILTRWQASQFALKS